MNCLYCEEKILPADRTHTYANGPVVHKECFLRGIFGSVAHLEKRCGCYVPNSTENDPPGLTRREAALLAVKKYYEMHTEWILYEGGKGK